MGGERWPLRRLPESQIHTPQCCTLTVSSQVCFYWGLGPQSCLSPPVQKGRLHLKAMAWWHSQQSPWMYCLALTSATEATVENHT